MTKEKLLPKFDPTRVFPTAPTENAPVRATRIQLTLGTLPEIGKEGAKFDKKALESMQAIVREFQDEDQKAGYYLGIPDPDSAIEIMGNIRVMGQTSYDNACKQLVWPQAFVIERATAWKSVPKRFEPGTMTASVYRLARVWGELVRYILIMMGVSAEIGIGFAFGKDFRALASGGQYVCINPFKNLHEGNDGDIWDPSNPADLRELYASAMHELTHVVDHVSEHDESYASALTRNIAKAPLGMCDLRGLMKNLKLRLPEALRPEKTEPKPAAPNKGDIEAYWTLRMMAWWADNYGEDYNKLGGKALALLLKRLELKPRPKGWDGDDAKTPGVLMALAYKALKSGYLALDRGAIFFGGTYGVDRYQFKLFSDGSKAIRRWEAIEAAKDEAVKLSEPPGSVVGPEVGYYVARDLPPLQSERLDAQWDADKDPEVHSVYRHADELLTHLGSMDYPFYDARQKEGTREGRIAKYVSVSRRLQGYVHRALAEIAGVEEESLERNAGWGDEFLATGKVATNWCQLTRIYQDGKDNYGLNTTNAKAKATVIWNIARRRNIEGWRDIVLLTPRLTVDPTWTTDYRHVDVTRLATIVEAIEELTDYRAVYEGVSTDEARAAALAENDANAATAMEKIAESVFSNAPVRYADQDEAMQMGRMIIEVGVAMLPGGHELAIVKPNASYYTPYDVFIETTDPDATFVWVKAGEAYEYATLRSPYVGKKARLSVLGTQVVAGSEMAPT